MKQFSVALCFALIAAVSAISVPQNGYKYQTPLPVKQILPNGNLRPQTPQSNSGIFSNVQSQPIAQFNQGPALISQPAPVSIPQPAPAPIYTQQAQVQQQNGFIPSQAPIQQTISVSQPQQIFSQPITQPIIQPISQPISYQPQQQIQQQQQVQQQQQIQHQQIQQQQQIPQQQQQLFVPNYQPQPQQEFVQNYQQPQQQIVQNIQRPSIVTKDIYIHSAPEETEEISVGPQLDNVPVRKNYRIVFIKAPHQNIRHTAAALKRAQASNEEKTVIYVLSKKPDITEIQQQLQLTQTEQKVHKPEVYFIKYKTQEEAARAQQEIQAQYDALGGATHISDEGIAPITSITGGSINLGAIGQNIISGGGAIGQNIVSGGGSIGQNIISGGSGSISVQPQVQTIVQNGQQQQFSSQFSSGGSVSFGNSQSTKSKA